jgi:hypothetical protein
MSETKNTKPESASASLWALALDCAGQNFDSEFGFDIMHNRTADEFAIIEEWAAMYITEGMISE